MSSHTSIPSQSGFRIYAQLCPRTPAKKSDPFSAKVKLSHSKNMSDFEYTCSGIGLPISQGNGLERVGPRSPPLPRCGRMVFPLRLLALPLWSICPPGCSLPLGGRCVLLVAPPPTWSICHPLSSICPWFPPPPCGRLKFYIFDVNSINNRNCFLNIGLKNGL